MSRWTMPLAWAASSASAMSMPRASKVPVSSGLPAMRLFSVSPFQVFHHDERLAFVLRDFVDGADVGMVQRRRRPRLSAEAFQGLRVFGHRFRQELQSDHAAEFEVLGLVDHTHPAATELLDDAVVRDGLPEHWRESYGLNCDKSMKVDQLTAPRCTAQPAAHVFPSPLTRLLSGRTRNSGRWSAEYRSAWLPLADW